MNLVIVHYHLNRGGVARVIENHLAGIDAALGEMAPEGKPWRVAVLYGGRHEGFDTELCGRLRRVDVSLEVVPLLEYDAATEPMETPSPTEPLCQQITTTLERLGLAPAETVLHFHNHSLGKNIAVPAVVGRLAEMGHGVLLQIHDFAEDFRPTNYARVRNKSVLYPQASTIHYAALNGRDRDILAAAGVDSDRLHLLPNPVPELTALPDQTAARDRLHALFGVEHDAQFVLYPVRGIRRKNLGEMLLYSAMVPKGTFVGLTLSPLNPAERPVYDGWKSLAAELHLPCLFETGAPEALSFGENLAAADVILTTSLAEGFGMVFLEAWLAGRPLVGRDLPEITPDFQHAGLRFDHLWRRLRVPLDWIGGTATFLKAAEAKYARALEAYGFPESPNDSDCLKPVKLLCGKIESAPKHGPMVDFGDLDETLQERVIRAVHSDTSKRDLLLMYNPTLERAVHIRPSETAMTIRHNAESIRRRFSLAATGRQLVGLYKRLATAAGHMIGPATVTVLPCSEQIIARFLHADRFRMIRE